MLPVIVAEVARFFAQRLYKRIVVYQYGRNPSGLLLSFAGFPVSLFGLEFQVVVALLENGIAQTCLTLEEKYQQGSQHENKKKRKQAGQHQVGLALFSKFLFECYLLANYLGSRLLLVVFAKKRLIFSKIL